MVDKLPTYKMVFGFVLLIATVALATIIALGKVEERTSFGLPYILGGLSSMSGGFVQWAFSSAGSSDGNKQR